jgi:hypothetical protein
MPNIYVATGDGLHAFDERGNAQPAQLVGHSITAVMRDGPQLWAIVDGTEIWHAPEQEWTDIAHLEVLTATCIAMTDAVLVGSSEARLFRLDGSRLEPITGFDLAAGRAGWYTPWGGPPDTRSITEWNDDVFVNVHVGGILHTNDHGDTWRPTIDIDADVHQVAITEELVLAACAGGLAVSPDRGATWTMRSDGLDAPYARAVVVCGDALLVSASSGPRGGRAGIYRGDLAVGRFDRCATEWFDDNIDTYCLDALNDGSFAAFGTSDGRLFGSDDAHELTSELPPIRHVLIAP